MEPFRFWKRLGGTLEASIEGPLLALFSKGTLVRNATVTENTSYCEALEDGGFNVAAISV